MKTTKEQILKIIGQLQYEISLLEQSEEELKGVTIRTEALKELFPEAFEPEWETFEGFEDHSDPYMSRRNLGNLKRKGLHLDAYYNWSIATDDEGVQVLQAVKK